MNYWNAGEEEGCFDGTVCYLRPTGRFRTRNSSRSVGVGCRVAVDVANDIDAAFGCKCKYCIYQGFDNHISRIYTVGKLIRKLATEKYATYKSLD